MKTRALCIVAGVCAALLLGGCEQTRNFLGLSKRSPDEFAVYSRAPLSLPPDFALRPPEPGSDRPNRVMPSDGARSALSGGDGGPPRNSDVPLSTGTQALLAQLGANETDPDIRRVVNRETSILAEEGERFADALIFWREKEPFGDVVDPQEEAKRIQEAKALGKPLDGGETPVITRQRKGLFEGIF